MTRFPLSRLPLLLGPKTDRIQGAERGTTDSHDLYVSHLRPMVPQNMWDRNARDSLTRLLCIAAISLISWIGGCAGAPEEKTWIAVGTTTREEVVKRYGQPDIIQMSGEDSIVTYWPASARPIRPQMEIPTVQAGPSGTTTTQMTPIEPGLDRPDTQERPLQEIQIRYDAQGVVREVMP
jgi:hypothetical protein